MRLVAAVLAVALLASPAPVLAQVRLAPEVALVSHSKSQSYEVEPGVTGTFAPGTATRLGLRASATGGRTRLELLVARGTTGLVAGLPGFGDVESDGLTFTTWTFMPTVGWAALGGGGGSGLWLHAGPSFDLWELTSAETRFLVSVAGAVSLEAPLSRHLDLLVRVEGALGPTVMGDELSELNPDSHAGNRLAVGVGLGWWVSRRAPAQAAAPQATQ